MKKLLIIDGNSILNRAYWAIKILTTREGIPTNAVYGFLATLFKLFEDENPDMLAVAFDLREKTFRHLEYGAYKATRKGMPDDLAQQMPVLKEILAAMNIKTLELAGFEADDIIGTVSKLCGESGVMCLIATGDKDDLQLIGGNTTVLLTTTQKGLSTTERYDAVRLKEKYDVTPDEFLQVKALMGDTSDNIPGVAGIGEKTAFALITEYSTLDNVYANIDKIKPSLAKKLTDGREQAYLSLRLATIVTDAPIGFEPEHARVNEYDRAKLLELFTKYEFKSFVKKLDLEGSSAPAGSSFEIDGEDGIFYYYISGETVYWFHGGENKTAAVAEVREILRDEDIKKCGVNVKDNYGVRGIIFDVALAAYLINPARTKYELPDLCFEYLGVEECGAQHLQPLMKLLKGKLTENGQLELLENIEIPLSGVLADMQEVGIMVDSNMLAEFGAMLKAREAELENEIFSIAGEEFNIKSPKQLGIILFEKLGLKVGKKTKTGYSTDADALAK